MRVLALAAAAAAAAAQTNVTGSVYVNGGVWSFVGGKIDPASVAYATYSDMTSSAAAFGSLSVVSNPGPTDLVQMYGAGYVEGVMTQPRIKQQFDNVYAWILSNFGGGPIPAAFNTFFDTQDAWARSQVKANASSYWTSIGLILAQFDGLVAGYNAVAPPADALTVRDLQLLNAIGDLLDLIPAIGTPGAPYMKPFDWDSMTAEQIMERVRVTTHCSALTKVNGDLTEMWWAHSAWFIYQSTNRIFKHYAFQLADPAMVGTRMSFSSYPGYLSSLDDFYQMYSSGLVMLETTNSIFNSSLYKQVVPQSLWAWQRVRRANLVSTTGAEWYASFAAQNSGTYNNQYDIIDVKLFTPGKALKPNTLWVIEQIPGLVVGGDVTQELERGYFPSYNVPYWPEIYQQSGYAALAARFAGNETAVNELAGTDYQLAPRAKIFRRDQGKVNDTASFAAIMRYNDYLNDPYSKGSPWSAICSRGDLAGSPDGCLDTKFGQYSTFASLQSQAINGPTQGDGSLPPFAWSKFPSTPHEGLPLVYDYTFAVQQPSNWPT